MTNLEYLKKARLSDVAIELVCNKFESATQAAEWLQNERIERYIMSFEEMLNLEFFSRDLYKTITVRNFLKKILATFVGEREEFSTKRPFGNSDWDSDLIILFIKKKIIKGKIDKYDSINDFDERQFNLILQELIKEL